MQGKPHDVEVVPPDARDEEGRLALDAVGPGLVHGVPGADVGPDLPLRHGAEGDLRALRADLQPVPPGHGHPGTHRVGPPREGGEHGERLRLAPRLPQPRAVQEHHGVRRDDEGLPVPGQVPGGFRLFAADGADDLLRRLGAVEALVRLRDQYLEFQPDLPQELPPPGRLGG